MIAAIAGAVVLGIVVIIVLLGIAYGAGYSQGLEDEHQRWLDGTCSVRHR